MISSNLDFSLGKFLGLKLGSYRAGDLTSAANVIDCAGFNSFAATPKYFLAAISTPYAFLPK